MLVTVRGVSSSPGVIALALKRVCGCVFRVYTALPRTLLRDFCQFMFLQKVSEVSAASHIS